MKAVLAANGLAACSHVIGCVEASDDFVITSGDAVVIERSRTELRTIWAETTHKMQSLRDNSACADQEHEAKKDNSDPGLNVKLSFDVKEDVAAPYIATGVKLRWQFFVSRVLTLTLKWQPRLTVLALKQQTST
ncbi:phosphoribosylformylglycinamidine synthase synthetase subunit and glutamine amidotransferase subunit [Vibrio variabilis]|uniref:Phosphoribosylformylglycinamidine synthase synthetase subunit and glutamine amidotransferase subunit n=1 Tax=Vibrio variabilis TaxID=990271 RepID=A0ABQ0J4P4_9VIBR|nr:phosphoribosylformylglycinamidine synthase synthetase subunit and glutamine amidotransferase subunit [Vibrio variabilis]